jgi:hypothetical protein
MIVYDPFMGSGTTNLTANTIGVNSYDLALNILNDKTEREIDRIVIELHSTLGEVKEYAFTHVADAIVFLNTHELKRAFITSDSLTLFDPPPALDDDE